MSARSFSRRVLVMFLPLLTACAAAVRIKNPVTIERVGRSEDPATDETGIYSASEGMLPAGSRPVRSPPFTCCENNFRVTAVKLLGQSNTAAMGGAVSEVRVDFETDVKVDCAAMAEPGGGTRPAATCYVAFQTVAATTKPAFSRNPGGARMVPAVERIWWTSKEEKCDARGKSAKLHVVYVARFPFVGVPRDVAGEPPSQVVLRLDPKPNAGRAHEVTIKLSQLNQGRRLEATLTHRPL